MKDIIEENKKLLDQLYKASEDNKEARATSIDTFRSKLLGFIDQSLGSVQRSQALLDLVDGEIIKKLLLHEYNKNELLDLRSNLIQASNSKTSVLLDPFKPTNNGGNNLITPPSDSATSEEDILKNVTPEGRQALNKLYLLLQSKSNKEEDKE